MNQSCSPLSQNHAPEGSPNCQCETDGEIRQRKKTIIELRQDQGERTDQLQAKTTENTKLKAELKKTTWINSKRKKNTVKLIRAKDSSLKEQIMLRTEVNKIMRKSLEKQDNLPYSATAITVQTKSSVSEEDWQYVYRNRKQKISLSFSDSSSESGVTCVSTCDERWRNVCASKMQYIK